MVGTKGGSSTHDTAYMSEQFYADGDGRIFMYRRGSRRYLTIQEIAERARWERRWGHKLRVRVQAKSVPMEVSK